MRTIIIIIFIISFTDIFSQNDTIFIKYKDSYSDNPNYTTDTLTYIGNRTPPILVGTTKLPMTFNQLAARRFDICFDSISYSPCNLNTNDIDFKDQVEYVNLTDTTMSISIKFESNCCFSFLGDIGYENDSTLKLIYYEYGKNHCACECCFGLKYHLKTKCLRGEENELKYIIINNDKQSLYKIKK